MTRGYEHVTNADLAQFIRSGWNEYWQARNDMNASREDDERYQRLSIAFQSAHKHLLPLRLECRLRTGSVHCEDDAIRLLMARPGYIRVTKV